MTGRLRSPPVERCPIAARIRDRLLERFDAHFAEDDVRDRLKERLDLTAPALTALVQHVAATLFIEAFDDAHDGPPGLIRRGGIGRAGVVRTAAFAASIGA